VRLLGVTIAGLEQHDVQANPQMSLAL
jgi:hypothetical protein